MHDRSKRVIFEILIVVCRSGERVDFEHQFVVLIRCFDSYPWYLVTKLFFNFQGFLEDYFTATEPNYREADDF